MTSPAFDMPEKSAALQLIQDAAAAARAAEAAVAEARHEVALLREECRRMQQLIDRHELLIDGNGGEGLKERMSHVERTARGNRDSVNVMRDTLATRSVQREGFKWDFWKVVIAAALSAAGGAIAAIMAGG